MSNSLVEIAEDSARGSFFLVTGSILAMIIQSVVVFVVARVLGPESYGMYTLSFVVPSVLVSFIGLGVSQGLAYFSASFRARQKDRELAKLLRDGLLFKILFALMMFGVCFVFSDYFASYVLNRPSIGFYIRLTSISIVLSVIIGSANSIFVGFDKMEYRAIITVVGALVKAVAVLLLLALGFSIIGAIVGYIIGLLVSGLSGVCILYFRLYKQLSPNASGQSQPYWVSVRTLLHYGFPLYTSAILLGFFPQLQNIVLAFFAGDVDIGNFQAMLNFGTLLSVPYISIATSLFPAFSKFQVNSEKARRFFTIAVKYTSLIMVPTTLMVIICSRELVEVIYGGLYVSASTFLSLYSLLYLLIGLGHQVQSSFFNGLAETRTTLKRGLLIFLLFVLLGPLLALFFNVLGLIVAILASNTIGAIYGAYVVKSKFQCEFNHRNLIRLYLVAFVSSGPAVFVLQFLPYSALFRVLTTGVIYLMSYVTLLPLLKVVTHSELKNVQHVVGRVPGLKHLLKAFIRYECVLMGDLHERTNDH